MRTADRFAGRRPEAAIAAVALTPYLALAFPYQLGLVVQAAVIIAIIAVAPGASWREAGARVAAAPRAVVWGLALWSGAAAWGALVGALSGNPLRYLGSQAVAMLLLPYATVAFLCAPGPVARPLVRGLAAAAIAALALQALGPLVPGLAVGRDDSGGRFALRFSTGFGGRDMVAFLTALAFFLVERSVLVAAGGACALVLVIGGMSRGAWVSAALGTVVVLAMHAGLSSRRVRAAVVAALASVAIGVALVALVGKVGDPIARLTPDTPGVALAAPSVSGSGDEAPGRLAVEFSEALRRVDLVTPLPGGDVNVALSVRTHGESGSRGRLVIAALAERGGEIRSFAVPLAGKGIWETRRKVLPIPPGSARLRVTLSASRGRWLIDELRVDALTSRPALLTRLLHDRIHSLLDVLGSPLADGTVRYRFNEWTSVWRRWSQAGVVRAIAGQGLGALVQFSNSGWTDDGRRRELPLASYLHNFYVFLAFKLGLAGLAALAGLLLIAGWTASQAWRRRSEPGEQWMLAAALGCWVAYLLWGVSSPEIIDFRVAPLLGAVVAASVTAGRAPRGAP